MIFSIAKSELKKLKEIEGEEENVNIILKNICTGLNNRE